MSPPALKENISNFQQGSRYKDQPKCNPNGATESLEVSPCCEDQAEHCTLAICGSLSICVAWWPIEHTIKCSVHISKIASLSVRRVLSSS